MALLNRSWRLLISKHYSWTRFPIRGPHSSLLGFLLFFDSFSELTGIHIPDFPGQLLNLTRLIRLLNTESLGVRRITQHDKFSLLLQSPIILRKLTELSLQYRSNLSLF